MTLVFYSPKGAILMAENDVAEQQGDPGAEPQADESNDSGAVKALRAEREARKAAETSSKELAERIKQFEDRDKTAEERMTETVNSATAKAAEYEARAMRAEVALEQGLKPEIAARLRGNTREELEADAVELAALIGETAAPRTPKPDPNQGRFQAMSDADAEARSVLGF